MLLVAGVAVAAIVNLLAEGPASGDEQVVATSAAETAPTTGAETGPGPFPSLIPLPGELRQEGGRLWWSSNACRIGWLDLASGAVTRLTREHCRIWPAPDGRSAVAVSTRRADALAGHGLVLIDAVAPQPTEAVFEHARGFVASEVAWRADGSAFAVCFGTRDGTVVDVIEPGRGQDELAGMCFPGFLADGRLALARVSPVAVVVDGVTVIAPERAAQLLPDVPNGERRAVSAVGVGGVGLAVGLVAVSDTRLLPSSAAIAVLDPAGGVVFRGGLYPSDTLPAVLGLAPDGSALWYLDTGNGRAVVVSIPGGRRLTFFTARWFAWSPDGRFLAVARSDDVALLSWPDGREIATIPVNAASISWTRAPL